MAISELCFSDRGANPHIVTIPHGYFDDISFGADWYSGHFIHEGPGQPKVTDLCNIKPEIRQDDGNLSVSGRIDTQLGPLYETVSIPQGGSSLTYQYRMGWKTVPAGSVRLGHITLNPEAFDCSSLFYRTCNGGKKPETFLLQCLRFWTKYPGILPLYVYSDHGAGLESTSISTRVRKPGQSSFHLAPHEGAKV